jgi:phage nucleotide-binding protein
MLKTTKLSDLPSVGVSCLIYSEPGMGKTSLLGTLPGKTLILDMDHGTSVLKGCKADIEIYHVKPDLSDLKELFDELRTDKKYNNVCLDTGTELEKAMLVQYGANGKNDGAPELRHYNSTQFKLRDYIRTLRDMTQRGINVFITAWEMPLEITQLDGVIQTKAYPMFSTKLSPEICGLFNIVGRIEQGKEERFIRLAQNSICIAKDRLFYRKACACNAEILLKGEVK